MAGAGPMPTPTPTATTFSYLENVSPVGTLLRPASETGRAVETITQQTSGNTNVTTTAPKVILTTASLSINSNAAAVFQFYNPNIRAGASLINLSMQGMYNAFSGSPSWPIAGGAYGNIEMPRVFVYNVVNGACTIVIVNISQSQALSSTRLVLAIEIVN